MPRSKPRPMLRHTSRFRGDVAAVLNGLTAEGVIASYRTNIEGQGRPDRLEVTVEGPEHGTARNIEKQVRDALASLHDNISVTIANKPAPNSKLADDLGGFASRADFSGEHVAAALSRISDDVARALTRIESGDASEADLRDVRVCLVDVLEIAEPDPALEAACDDLYGAASAFVAARNVPDRQRLLREAYLRFQTRLASARA